MTSEKLTRMHACWAGILQEYDVDIQHRSGVTHGDADGLSRNPLIVKRIGLMPGCIMTVLRTSAIAGLELLACVGTEAFETAADQSDFGGTEKDGDPQATESGAATNRIS
jgi:hypothetical protein